MSEDYKIKYSSKDQFYVMVLQRLCDWSTQLQELEGKLTAIADMESFQGTTADSVKAYFKEVHYFLLISVRQAIFDFQSKISLYSSDYYEIEPNLYAVISQETLRELKKKAQAEQEYLQTQKSEISKSINTISDLERFTNPSQENILDAFGDTITKIDTLDTQIADYEASQKQKAGELGELIASLYNAINTYYMLGGNITGYQAGDYTAKTEVLDLYKKVSSSMEYTSENQDAVLEANNNMMDVFAQQQKDYEEACEARQDEGTANIIVGGLAVIGGVTAIVLTAGAATPIVVTAAVSGTCAAAYGVSNVVEGAQDVYYGSIGNLSTDAWNPIRDTVFCGNQELYDTWGSLNLTVAGLCVPVNSAVNAVAGSSGKVIATEVAKTFVEESVKGHVLGKVGDAATNTIAQELDLNKTETVILGQVIDKGLDKGVEAAENAYVKRRDGHADADFTDKMSYEDAKRYNAFTNDPDGYRATLDQVDADLSKIDGIDETSFKASDVDAVRSNAATEPDYSTGMNTPEEQAILKDMELKGEFNVGKEDYSPVKVNPDASDPADVRGRLPTENKGTIIGDRDTGTFEYIPDDPKAQQTMADYGVDTVHYTNGEPDFSPFTKHDTQQWGKVDCEVEIGYMNSSRTGDDFTMGNYEQADIALSEKISTETGTTVTQAEIKAYRESNGLTWHETSDGKTMQLVPTEINAKCAHNGGVSVKKYQQAWGDVALDY